MTDEYQTYINVQLRIDHNNKIVSSKHKEKQKSHRIRY